MDRIASGAAQAPAAGLAADLPAPAAQPDPVFMAKATEAAVKFESFFIGHRLHQMRSSTRELAGEDSIYHDSINSDMLEMADNQVADQMAGKRAFGIADAILRQLLPPAAAPAAAAGAALVPARNNVKSA
jgi:flagellar protein FlgJ